MTHLKIIEKQPDDKPLVFAEIQAQLSGLIESGDHGAVRVLDVALAQAAAHRASDVHVEPWRDSITVRFRIDGILHNVARLPREHHERIAGRIKVLAHIPSYIKDTPQDGRIEPDASACRKALRVSSFPTVEGEKFILRVLDVDTGLFSLDALGFDAATVEALRSIIGRPHGTLLLTGPASSGKTTTIYSLLNEILQHRDPPPHTVTIEDPVECLLPHVSQAQVNPHTGFTFETALKAILRQDPEVIMIGEIRDPKTARAAIQAGLTGHLVISTVHSASAAGVFTRLLDMGIEPYLVASSITGVLSQRLLRRTCPQCARPYSPDPSVAARLSLGSFSGEGRTIEGDAVDHPSPPPYRVGAGCQDCLNIGYKSRIAVGELLTANEDISNLLLSRPRTSELHRVAVQAGMVPLARAAARLCQSGVTTVEEVCRVVAPEHGGSQ